jgi:hypothetical protein
VRAHATVSGRNERQCGEWMPAITNCNVGSIRRLICSSTLAPIRFVITESEENERSHKDTPLRTPVGLTIIFECIIERAKSRDLYLLGDAQIPARSPLSSARSLTLTRPLNTSSSGEAP